MDEALNQYLGNLGRLKERGIRWVYLAGPMTGLPKWNHPAFHAAAKRLRDSGLMVHNPAELFDGDTSRPRGEYIRRDVMYVRAADAVIVLPGWEGSCGACLETELARQIGTPVLEAETLDEILLENHAFANHPGIPVLAGGD